MTTPVAVYAEGTWTTSSHPGEGCIATTAAGATVTADWFCVHNDGGATLGSPTGGDLGAGTLNLAALAYVNNVAVVTLSATQTLTNKTIVSSTDVLGGVTITLGSDATGDIHYRNSSGVWTRLAVGSGNTFLGVSGGLPAWGQVAFSQLNGTCTTAQGCLGLTAAAIGDIIYASATTPTWSRLADVATGALLASGGVGVAPSYCTACTIGTSVTSPIHYGGSATNSSNTIASTSNVSPSGDSVVIKQGGNALATFSGGAIGFGTETNPQAPVVISKNPATGIAAANAAALLNLIGANGASSAFGMQTYQNGTSTASGAVFSYVAGGTPASPSNLSSGAVLFNFGVFPYVGGAFATGSSARIIAQFNDTSPNTGTFWEFDTTPAGSATRAQAFRAMAGLVIGTATVDPGAGNGQASGWLGTGGSTISGSGTVTGQTCNSGAEGARYYVTNGVSAPSLGATVSTTGSTIQPVMCNGTNWVYGYLLDRDIDPAANDNAPVGLRVAA